MQTWQRGLLIVDGIYISRLLGMFLMFPIFSVYAQTLEGATPQWIGMALGAYGLTQGLLQIPFGMLSDRFGRKPLIFIGLSLFTLGSLWAAQTQSIAGMMGARLLQGMGAVSGVILAYTTDLMPKEKLALAMGIIGASIGLSFLLSLVIAPPLAAWLGTQGVFYVMAALAGSACLASLWLPPLPESASLEKIAGKVPLTSSLYWACVMVFLLHFIFTGCFVALPHMLQDKQTSALWLLYFPSNLIAMAFMRRRLPPHLLTFGLDFALFALGLLFLGYASGYWAFLGALSLFFMAFYRLETALPHFAAQGSAPEIRGKMMAYFTSSQFMGSFLGGTAAGAFWGYFSLSSVMFILFAVAVATAFVLFYVGKKDVG